MSFTAYRRPVNDPLKETLRVLNFSSNVNSTNRCIGYGLSFDFWGHYPIINSQATGNGGCDAILGRACSENIRTMLQESFRDIGDRGCGVLTPNILPYYPKRCPPPIGTKTLWVSSRFLEKGSFATANSSEPLRYHKSGTSVDDDYDDLMKDLVFTYFVGRPYSSGSIDSAIACFSFYNTTTKLSGIATQLFVSGQLLIFLPLLHFFSRFTVYLP